MAEYKFNRVTKEKSIRYRMVSCVYIIYIRMCIRKIECVYYLADFGNLYKKNQTHKSVPKIKEKQYSQFDLGNRSFSTPLMIN